MNKQLLALLVTCSLFVIPALSEGLAGFNGRWEFVPHKSTDIDLWGTLSVEIRQSGDAVTVINTWGRGRSFSDSLRLATDGSRTTVPVRNRVFPSNVFMGLMMPVGTDRRMTASWEDGGSVLKVDEEFRVRGSQGETAAHAVHRYVLAGDAETITYTIRRSTRTTGPEVRYVLKREGTAQAYMMRLEDNWEITGNFPSTLSSSACRDLPISAGRGSTLCTRRNGIFSIHPRSSTITKRSATTHSSNSGRRKRL